MPSPPNWRSSDSISDFFNQVILPLVCHNFSWLISDIRWKSIGFPRLIRSLHRSGVWASGRETIGLWIVTHAALMESGRLHVHSPSTACTQWCVLRRLKLKVILLHRQSSHNRAARIAPLASRILLHNSCFAKQHHNMAMFQKHQWRCNLVSSQTRAFATPTTF
jgi:hypothetical protein